MGGAWRRPLQAPLLPLDGKEEVAESRPWRRQLALRFVATLTALTIIAVAAFDSRPGHGVSEAGQSDGVALELAASSGSTVVQLMSLAFVIGLVAVGVLVLQGAVVSLAKSSIEYFDQIYLGVDVTIESMSFNAFTGRLDIRGCKVNNPEGYSDRGLLKASRFMVDVRTLRFVRSMGRELEITKLKVQGIHANMEFNGYLYGTSNVVTILQNLKNTTARPKGQIEPVYDYWHAANGEHTFHCEPAWDGETRNNVQFFAYTEHAPGTEPVYDYWHSCSREHLLHMAGQETGMGALVEWQGNVQFYAFREQAPGTEPVYKFWHTENREHTFHFLPAWPLEQQGEIVFYAYRHDPSGLSKAELTAAAVKPVYDFWASNLGQHTFHNLPAWSRERENNVVFYAYDRKVADTLAVWDFWHEESRKKRFHLGDPREGEVKRSPLFYVHTSHASGTEPVYEFYHKENDEYNIHMGEPWEGEDKRDVMFYAFREDPTQKKKLKVFLKSVKLEDITAESSTKMVGMKVSMEAMKYHDFSDQFKATAPQEVLSHLIDELFSKIRVRLT